MVWPNPRFTDNGNGTVTDNLTGLIWLKNASCLGPRNWATALNDANRLNSGECGLTDGSVEGDWRLPNLRELQSLVDYARFNPALPSDHPFTNVQSNDYWTSTTYVGGTSYVWTVYLHSGHVEGYVRTIGFFVWPVRGG